MSNDERRYEHRPHEERVEQDAERDHEADLGQEDERQRAEDAERAREHDPGRGDHAAGDRQAAQHALARAVAERLLAHARHQEDVVVDPERDEEHERPAAAATGPRREVEDELEEEAPTPSAARNDSTTVPISISGSEQRPQQQREHQETTSSTSGTITPRVARRPTCAGRAPPRSGRRSARPLPRPAWRPSRRRGIWSNASSSRDRRSSVRSKRAPGRPGLDRPDAARHLGRRSSAARTSSTCSASRHEDGVRHVGAGREGARDQLLPARRALLVAEPVAGREVRVEVDEPERTSRRRAATSRSRPRRGPSRRARRCAARCRASRRSAEAQSAAIACPRCRGAG